MPTLLRILVAEAAAVQAVHLPNATTTPLIMDREQQELLELLTVEQVEEVETFLVLPRSLEVEALMLLATVAAVVAVVVPHLLAILILILILLNIPINFHQALLNRMVLVDMVQALRF
jgi:hypothetical protein